MPSRTSRTLAVTATTALVALGAVSLVQPGWFALAGVRPWLYAASFRVPVVLGLAGVAVLAGAVAAVRGRRPGGLPAGATAVACAVSAALGAAVVLDRGPGAGGLPQPRPGDVTVVAANTEYAGVDPDVLARVVLRSGADVVAMPETTRELAGAVAAAVRRGGGPRMQVFAQQESGQANHSTALLVSDRWGEYRRLPADDLRMVLGAVTVVPVAGDGPPLAAVHPMAPVGDQLSPWTAEGRAAVRWCRQHPGAVVAGDFNATLDHPGLRELGGCTDVSAATGTGARGTWPARVPAVLGAPIDHVLVDSRRWRPVASEVVELGGSDHRAVVARVRPA